MISKLHPDRSILRKEMRQEGMWQGLCGCEWCKINGASGGVLDNNVIH